VSTEQTPQNEALSDRIARLAHSIGLLEALNEAKHSGVSRRTAMRRMHANLDIRHSVGEEQGESNPHVDRRRKREMRLRPEHTGAQRMMRQRQRDILAGEEDTERLIHLADDEFDMDIEPVGKEMHNGE
jgi:hypothetical protein